MRTNDNRYPTTQRPQQGGVPAYAYRRAHPEPDYGAHVRLLALTRQPHRAQEEQVQL